MLKNNVSVKVSWGHCDPAKIVFYPNYFIWFDQNAHNLFNKAGLNMGHLMDKYGVVGLPIVNAHADFLYPSKYSDVIEYEVGFIHNAYPILNIGIHEKIKPAVSYFSSFENHLLHGRNAQFEYVHVHDLLQSSKEIIHKTFS